MSTEITQLSVTELELEQTRPIRANVVDDIKDRIEADGYNPARPLRVIPNDGDYIVADGNHRARALEEMGYEDTVPCLVEPDGDLYEIARKSNRDEDTYAPEDLFDHLYKINKLGDDHTQAGIAETMGDEWSRSNVQNHVRVLNKVDTEILHLARGHQEGRVSDNDTEVSFNFTERWFRNSGLYDIQTDPTATPEYEMPDPESSSDDSDEDTAASIDFPQVTSSDTGDRHPTDIWQTDDDDEPKRPQERFMEWFIGENCDVSATKFDNKIERIEETQAQLETINDELNSGVDDDAYEGIYRAVIRGEHSDDSLETSIENANTDAKDQAHFGVDGIEKLEEYDENSFDCVVTDPPYGMEHTTHRHANENTDFDGDVSDALSLFDAALNELQRVCKENAHLYVFFPITEYPEVREIATEYFEIDEKPLIWVKNNHAPTRDMEKGFDKIYAPQYEPVLHLRGEKDTRELQGGACSNILKHDIPKSEDRWHSTQKPISLWEELITNSTAQGETVVDPFAGSGSALIAAKRTDRRYIGMEENEEYESRFKREIREVSDGD